MWREARVLWLSCCLQEEGVPTVASVLHKEEFAEMSETSKWEAMTVIRSIKELSRDRPYPPSSLDRAHK